MNIILAVSENNGIGFQGKIPWKCEEDLKLFKDFTDNCVVIVGRKTAEKLPYLYRRIVLVVSKSLRSVKNYISFQNIIEAINFSKSIYPDKTIFIGGGGEIYDYVFKNLSWCIDNIFISRIKVNTECDTFVDLNFLNNWESVKKIEYNEFTFFQYKKKIHEEYQYLNLLKNILSLGEKRIGRNGETKSIFGATMKFNLDNGFPLLTTKKMFFRGIVEELLFFIRGETDSKILENKGVCIWRGNTNRNFLDSLNMHDRPEGIMGPLYGYQWRFFNSEYDYVSGKPKSKGIDQLEYVINEIKNNSTSRRILLTDFNPAQVSECVLYPCHSLILQFYVENNYLDMSCYNRSQDVFLGTPFNIASSALFLTLIANITGTKPRNLIMNLGDSHIYSEHYEKAQLQLQRYPHNFPKLLVKKQLNTIKELENLEYSDFQLENYVSHPAIEAKMVC